MRRAPALALMLAASALPGCRSSPVWTAVAPDNRTTVRVTAQRGQDCVAVGSRRDGCYARVALRWLTFDESGRHVAYPAGAGSRWIIVRDGVPGAAWDAVGRPVLSRTGARLAYPARHGAAWHVVVDGVPGPAFDSIIAGSVTFSPSGSRVAYLGARRDSTGVVIDAATIGTWRDAGHVQFDSSGARAVHRVRIGDRWHVAVDGAPGAGFDEVGAITIGSAGQIAYAARAGPHWHLVSDGRLSEPYDAIRALALSPGSGRPVFIARRRGREAVIRDGTTIRWHDSVSSYSEAPDGAHGYIAHERGATTVVIRDRVIAHRDVPADFAIGGAGRYAILVLRDTLMVVVDDRGEHAFDLVVAGSLQYVRPHSWAALAGTRGTRELFVVVDGRRVGRPFDWVEMTRRMASGDGAEAIRTWVRAEAALHRPP